MLQAPKGRVSKLFVGLVAVTGVVTVGAQAVSADLTTISIDQTRAGLDTNESGLVPPLTGVSQKFNTAVNGAVLAQPLVVTTSVGRLVIAATENDSVYGINPTTGSIAWSKSVGTPEPSSVITCNDVTPNYGITSTPVFDPASGIVYLTARNYVNGVPSIRMWALNANNGSTVSGWPHTISGAADNDSTTSFNASLQNQRAGLLLRNGRVYAGFGSMCDLGDYRGWVVSLSTANTTYSQHRWVDEANPLGGTANILGGIWQSGGGLAVDAQGRIFLGTGNGTSPGVGSGTSFQKALGDSVVDLKVDPTTNTMSAADHYTPPNADQLNATDGDLGSGGPAVLPDGFGGTPTTTHLLLEPSKTAIHLLNRDALGGYPGIGGPDPGVAKDPSQTWGHPAIWWDGVPTDPAYVYVVQNNTSAAIKVYQVQYDSSTGKITFPLVAANGDNLGSFPGSPVVTSNGTDPTSAVLWITTRTGATSQLRAYKAVPVNGSLQRVAVLGSFTAAKFGVPATDRNQVFIGTQLGHVQKFSP
jgi:hypothetical protein